MSHEWLGTWRSIWSGQADPVSYRKVGCAGSGFLKLLRLLQDIWTDGLVGF